ncbi:MAG TPA: isoprenylcysteine carboxylmethyltransferase family protein [Woeseiaceae bacterium]|nr:isoprenylcysteine carboxylmethyltransferase family protein [Woeseiaceae bacterium]
MKMLELKVPPVAQFLAFVVVMWLLEKYLPALSFEIPARRTLVVLFFCLGGIVAVPAVAAFRSSGTTVDPRDPGKASRLVVRGIYRYSRNPMYLGLLFLLIAWSLYLSNLLGFAGLPLFVLAMNRLQIGPEEAAMEAQFGDEYRSYRESVRRWL